MGRRGTRVGVDDLVRRRGQRHDARLVRDLERLRQALQRFSKDEALAEPLSESVSKAEDSDLCWNFDDNDEGQEVTRTFSRCPFTPECRSFVGLVPETEPAAGAVGRSSARWR